MPPRIRVLCYVLKQCEVQEIWNCTTSISIHLSTPLQLRTDRIREQKKRNGQIICDDELSDLIKLKANNTF